MKIDHSLSIYRLEKLPDVFDYLPLLALLIDLFTPFLIWKGILPSQLRWISHAAIAATIFIVVLRILTLKRLPPVLGLILTIGVLWSFIALARGQGLAATLWGVWLFFQFPMVGLFAYLKPQAFKQLPTSITKYALALLILQVIVQILQYAFGEPPGDNLAGLFGKNGTGINVVFVALVNCLFLGYWIIKRSWLGVAAAMLLGAISSVLGEMKIFPFALALVVFPAIVLYAVRHKALQIIFLYSTLAVVVLVGFVFLYNMIIPSAGHVPFETYIKDPTALFTYMNRADGYYTAEGKYATNIGRNYALSVGWKTIQADTMKFLFGYGLGARSESRTFNTAGIGLTSGELGLSSGTSLLIVMQEMGITGLLIVGIFILWVVFRLWHDIQKLPNSVSNGIRYGLGLGFLLMPVWYWYTNFWVMRVPMLMYFYLLGFVLAEAHPVQWAGKGG